MPSREPPSYSSQRVQRASRLNALEQHRLAQRMLLLEKARLHQAKLTNQDIRLTSTALEYILNCSGHSPEGRGPLGQAGAGGADSAHGEDEPTFLYGERVVSRKVRRMPRPHSAAMERSNFRRAAPGNAALDTASEDGGGGGGRKGLPPRPHSSPAKGRGAWTWTAGKEDEEEGGQSARDGALDSERWGTPRSVGAGGGGVSGGRAPSSTAGSWSRPSTGRGGRTTPHQAWEDDTDHVTKRLLKAQEQQELHDKQLEQQQNSRRSRRYMRDIGRLKSAASSRCFRQSPGGEGGGGHDSPSVNTPTPASPSPRIPSSGAMASSTGVAAAPQTWAPPEDRKPVSPQEKAAARPGGGGALGKRAGLAELTSQARGTRSASSWRAHLASTQTAPRSAQSQHQVIMEARRSSERQRQRSAMGKMESFMDRLAKDQWCSTLNGTAPATAAVNGGS